MMIKPQLKTWIGLLLAVVVTVIVGLNLPSIHYQPHGIFLPAENISAYRGPPIQTVFILRQAPNDYKKLGIINVEHHYTQQTAQQDVMQSIALAKKLAATHGATAIIVKRAFYTKPTGVEKGLPSFVFSGIAITVPQMGF